MATVVVGIDGSGGAHDALRFAVQEARLRGAVLRAVMAWDVTTMAHGGDWGPTADPTALEESARAALDTVVDTVDTEAEGVEIERVLSVGKPAQVLIDEARGADMLVVGSPRHGSLLSASVGHQCVQHAPCPVAVVPRLT